MITAVCEQPFAIGSGCVWVLWCSVVCHAQLSCTSDCCESVGEAVSISVLLASIENTSPFTGLVTETIGGTLLTTMLSVVARVMPATSVTLSVTVYVWGPLPKLKVCVGLA